MFQSLEAVGGFCRAAEEHIKSRVSSKKHLGWTKKKKNSFAFINESASRCRGQTRWKLGECELLRNLAIVQWIRMVPRVTGACDGEHVFSLSQLAHGVDVKM